MSQSKKKIFQNTQLELNIKRVPEKDRNFGKGGRSFYFFDFDDNVVTLPTLIYLFHKKTGQAFSITSQVFTENQNDIGQRGQFVDYEIKFDDATGSFINFRDTDPEDISKEPGKTQIFIEDMEKALRQPDYTWKGPSWSCFYHAVFNHRPIAVITARGHHPETIKEGIRLLVRDKHLPHEPSYLCMYPVNQPEIREQLTTSSKMKSVAELKQSAIRNSVYKAIEKYGDSPHHRFGMSDDDPKNIELIVQEMSQLKMEFSKMSFFVISTSGGKFIKKEVFADHTEDHPVRTREQLNLL